MGVDAADFNNDGRPDLMGPRHAAEHEKTLKTSPMPRASTCTI